jgi:hypothetical protein
LDFHPALLKFAQIGVLPERENPAVKMQFYAGHITLNQLNFAASRLKSYYEALWGLWKQETGEGTGMV